MPPQTLYLFNSFYFHLLPNGIFSTAIKAVVYYKYQILVSSVKFTIPYIHLKFELLDTLSPALQSGPHRSSDKFLCTSHSLEYLVSEDAEA